MIKALLVDLDNTIFDFSQSEREAIMGTLRTFNLDTGEDMAEFYSEINNMHWKMWERGEIGKLELRTRRFARFLETLGIDDIEPISMRDEYEGRLANGPCFLVDGARETLDELKDKGYLLCAASNGSSHVQFRRLAKSSLDKAFDDIFVSDMMGADKPNRLFFENCLNKHPEVPEDGWVMVGDSLTSDVKGANNAGILSIWYNHEGKRREPGAPYDGVPDYVIHGLRELPALVESL